MNGRSRRGEAPEREGQRLKTLLAQSPLKVARELGR